MAVVIVNTVVYGLMSCYPNVRAETGDTQHTAVRAVLRPQRGVISSYQGEPTAGQTELGGARIKLASIA